VETARYRFIVSDIFTRFNDFYDNLDVHRDFGNALLPDKLYKKSYFKFS